MSRPLPQPTRRTLGARNARSWRTVVALGLGVLVLTTACASDLPPASEVFATTEGTTTTVPDSSSSAGEDYRWRSGDCLDFSADDAEPPYAPYGSERVIPCSAPHTHEVYLAQTVADGPDAPYPDPGADVNDLCTGSFSAYVGAARVETTLEILFYFPDEEEWAEGERYRACLLFSPAPVVGVYELRTASVRNRADELTWRPKQGSCLDGDLWALRVADEIPCAEAHLLQVLGDARLDDAGPYPGPETLRATARARCRRLLPAEDPTVFVLSEPALLQPSEWEAGLRRVVCIGAAVGPGGDLVPVRGSFLGSWSLAGDGPRA